MLVTMINHPDSWRGLRLIIQSDEQINIIAEADNGREALELIQSSKPDVAVLDVNMPEMTGFDVVRELGKTNLATEFIFLTMHKDEAMFNTALDLGVKGYPSQESEPLIGIAPLEKLRRRVWQVVPTKNSIQPKLCTYRH